MFSGPQNVRNCRQARMLTFLHITDGPSLTSASRDQVAATHAERSTGEKAYAELIPSSGRHALALDQPGEAGNQPLRARSPPIPG